MQPDKSVLVFNVGSSSLSYKVFACRAGAEPRVIATGKAHRVGTASTEKPFLEHRLLSSGSTTREDRDTLPNHSAAATAILSFLRAQKVAIDLVGHRFVHGGVSFGESALVTADTRTKLGDCAQLAPIHNPAALSVLDVCCTVLGSSVSNFVVFDTAFHRDMPAEAYTYALPKGLADARGLRKFGFHGLSYAFVAEALRKRGLLKQRVVACHLGTGGSSVAGLRDGKTVDTSMGWSPLPGLVMSTRCGDVDASIALSLVDDVHSAADVLALLNTKSGLVGLTDGLTSDLRDVYKIAHTAEHPRQALCQLAYDVYVHRLVSHIGSLVALLGGIDVLAFTDDLGFNMPELRASVCLRLAWLGMHMDSATNDATTKGKGGLASSDTAIISTHSSIVSVVVVVNDEELVIAREATPFL